jgi:hypothetical protein
LYKSNSNLSGNSVSEFSFNETLTPKRILLKKNDEDNDDENKNLKIINCSGRKKIFINKDKRADLKLIKRDHK